MKSINHLSWNMAIVGQRCKMTKKGSLDADLSKDAGAVLTCTGTVDWTIGPHYQKSHTLQIKRFGYCTFNAFYFTLL